MSNKIDKKQDEKEKVVQVVETPIEEKEIKTPLKRVSMDSFPITKDVIEFDLGEGKKIEISDRLTVEDKVAVATQIAERIIVLDEPTGRGFYSIFRNQDTFLVLLEAYTNIEIPATKRYEFYDYILTDHVMRNGLLECVKEHTGVDWEITMSMGLSMAESAITHFDSKNTLDYFIKQLNSGGNAGEELLSMINKAATSTDETAMKIQKAYDDINKKDKPNPILNFSKKQK